VSEPEDECHLGGECPCAHHYGMHGSDLDDARRERDALRVEVDQARGCVVLANMVKDECEANDHMRANKGGQSTGDSPSLPPSVNHRWLRDAKHALDGSQGRYTHRFYVEMQDKLNAQDAELREWREAFKEGDADALASAARFQERLTEAEMAALDRAIAAAKKAHP